LEAYSRNFPAGHAGFVFQLKNEFAQTYASFRPVIIGIENAISEILTV
jgi:hypothetical protein